MQTKMLSALKQAAVFWFHAQSGDFLEVWTKWPLLGKDTQVNKDIIFPFSLVPFPFWSKIIWCWVVAVWVPQRPETTSSPAGVKSLWFLEQEHRCELWPLTPPSRSDLPELAPIKVHLCKLLRALKPWKTPSTENAFAGFYGAQADLSQHFSPTSLTLHLRLCLSISYSTVAWRLLLL